MRLSAGTALACFWTPQMGGFRFGSETPQKALEKEFKLQPYAGTVWRYAGNKSQERIEMMFWCGRPLTGGGQQKQQSRYSSRNLSAHVCQPVSLLFTIVHQATPSSPPSPIATMADNDTEMKDVQPEPEPQTQPSKEPSGTASGAATPTPKPREKPGRKPGVPQGPKKSVPKSKLKEEGNSDPSGAFNSRS